LSHLNFTDLKSCRGVSRTFLETIEAYEPFKKSQLLVISEDKFALGDLEPDLLQDWNLKQHIRNIRINVYDVEEELFHIPNAILNNVTFVSLLSKDLEDFDYTEPGPFRIIRRILSSARQMSHLQLDLRLLMVSLRQVFDSSDAIDENLKDLKHLDILGWTQRFRSTTYCIADENDDDDLLHFLSFFETNFVQLLSSLQSLETLHLPRFTFSQRQELEIQSAVVRLLQRNRESLRELSLHLGIWNGVLPVTLPRLRSLSATVSNRAQQDSLKDFLANANKDCLEELGVVVRTHEDYQFGKNLFDVIRQRSPTLKKLHLQAFKFVDEEGNAMSKVDWTFLGGMKYLRDFQLTRPRCVEPNLKSYGNGTILLESLPRNQLERLGLRGIGFNSFGFWRTDVNDKEPELPFKLNLLRGFRSLRRLSLCYCCDALDDDIVRFIVEEMTSLEELELSHCSRLTDRGIAGTSEDGSDSIRNLKRKWKTKQQFCLQKHFHLPQEIKAHVFLECCLVKI